MKQRVAAVTPAMLERGTAFPQRQELPEPFASYRYPNEIGRGDCWRAELTALRQRSARFASASLAAGIRRAAPRPRYLSARDRRYPPGR
jgi:hypothetical protein